MNMTLRNGIVLPLALGTLLATSLGATAAPAGIAADQSRREQRQEQRKDKREARQERLEDRKEARQDRQDVRQERREDRKVVRPVIVRPGHPAVVRQVDNDRRDDRQDRRQERREDRREIRQDRREDRHERREDRREVRQEIREDRREVRQDLRERRARARYYDDYLRRLHSYNSHRYSPRWYHSGNYRYFRGGTWYRVNYYGADMLRQAVDQGYREGLRAGTADRYDGWRGGYRDSRAWIDASYGYIGSYVSRAEYNYYFRQGFERGYEDGYYGRHRYGRAINGEVIIIDAVLRAILDLQRWG